MFKKLVASGGTERKCLKRVWVHFKFFQDMMMLDQT